MVRIKQDFIPQGRRNRPGYFMKPAYITIHDTANPNKGADAEAHARYLKSNAAARAPVSWHFTVDDHQAIQHLPLNENGWHCTDGHDGPGNRTSIGVEICENSDGNRAKAESNAAELVAHLLQKLNLSIDRVVQHHHWYNKNCPHILRGRPGGWEGFLAAVKSYMPETRKEREALTPIMGEPEATKEQARVWLQHKAPDWVLMADLYWSIAPRYNIRPDVALCQACKETGFFRFGGLVKPEQNNFCGLGATGKAATGNEPLRGADPERVRFEKGVHGAIFVDRATGVEAHIQHLYAYATTEPLPMGMQKVDPRFDLVHRGSASYVEHLGAAENPTGVGWAYPGHGYGKSIVQDYLADLLKTELPIGPHDSERLAVLKAENQQLRKQLEATVAENSQLRSTLEQIISIAKERIE
ncbi:MAG: N-acetylmuramoyl-L-alanine amidase [Deltaproteobacteria bacterium]|nr:N-acetylmuramoyl-L-alanine amidase [Deltaproteobacteria bacterium]